MDTVPSPSAVHQVYHIDVDSTFEFVLSDLESTSEDVFSCFSLNVLAWGNSRWSRITNRKFYRHATTNPTLNTPHDKFSDFLYV